MKTILLLIFLLTTLSLLGKDNFLQPYSLSAKLKYLDEKKNAQEIKIMVIKPFETDPIILYSRQDVLYKSLPWPTFMNIYQLSPSPDGRYLAVLSAGEGHPMLHVLETDEIVKHFENFEMADKKKEVYLKAYYSLNPYPGSVDIEKWSKDELILKSDMLLNFPYLNSSGHYLSLDANSFLKFSLSIKNLGIKSLDRNLDDPVKYALSILGNKKEEDRHELIQYQLTDIACHHEAVKKQVDAIRPDFIDCSKKSQP